MIRVEVVAENIGCALRTKHHEVRGAHPMSARLSGGCLPRPQRQRDQLGHTVHIELGHDVFAMLAHGGHAQIELAGDVFAGIALAQQADDFAFAA